MKKYVIGYDSGIDGSCLIIAVKENNKFYIKRLIYNKIAIKIILKIARLFKIRVN